MKKIDHIAIATKSLSQSLDFFEKKLGLKCDRVEELADRGIRVAFLPIGDTRIELIEPMREGSEISSFLDKRGPGIHHIAFEPDDIQSEFAKLKADGLPFTTETLTSGAHDAQVAFIHPKASSGVLIELTQKRK